MVIHRARPAPSLPSLRMPFKNEFTWSFLGGNCPVWAYLLPAFLPSYGYPVRSAFLKNSSFLWSRSPHWSHGYLWSELGSQLQKNNLHYFFLF